MLFWQVLASAGCYVLFIYSGLTADVQDFYGATLTISHYKIQSSGWSSKYFFLRVIPGNSRLKPYFTYKILHFNVPLVLKCIYRNKCSSAWSCSRPLGPIITQIRFTCQGLSHVKRGARLLCVFPLTPLILVTDILRTFKKAKNSRNSWMVLLRERMRHHHYTHTQIKRLYHFSPVFLAGRAQSAPKNYIRRSYAYSSICLKIKGFILL